MYGQAPRRRQRGSGAQGFLSLSHSLTEKRFPLGGIRRNRRPADHRGQASRFSRIFGHIPCIEEHGSPYSQEAYPKH